jgi:uncharacterized protein
VSGKIIRLAVSVVVFSAGLLGACSAVKPYDPVVEDPVVLNKEFPFDFKQIQFPSGGVELWGSLGIAQGKGPHPTVIVARGFPDPASNIDVVLALQRAGFNALSFYYRGYWGMGGTYTVMNSYEDLNAAIEFLRTEKAEKEWRVDPKRIILLGYSLGGPIALKAASQDRGIRAVVLIDPTDLRQFRNMTKKDNDEQIAYLGGVLGVRASGKQVVEEIVAQQGFWDPIAAVPGLSGKCVLTVWAAHGNGAEPIAPYFADAMHANDLFVGPTLETSHYFTDRRIALTRIIVSWAEGLQAQSCL